MMKLFPSLALILLAAAVASARQTPQREKDGPRAKVRTVRVERAMTEMVSGQILEGPRELSSSLVYDAEGRLIEDADYLPGGMPDTKRVCAYDAQGREVNHSYFVHDSLVRRWTATYDDKAKTGARVEYWGDGRVSGKYSEKYNARGDPVQIVERHPNGYVNQRWILTYDKHGDLIAKKEYERGRILRGRYAYTYDKDRNKTSETHFYRDGRSMRSSKTVFVYDAKGRLTEEALYFNGVLNGRTTYKYDSKGNRSEIVELNSDGSISGKSALSYEEFDAAGNWTKAVVSEWRSTEGQPDFRRDFALYRTLTYWDN